MINLTVKTLDNQNYKFTVEDNMTVEEFKRHIADTVGVPADIQRMIYYGKVLNDASKLNENDLDGKVVHLVQRPPPGATPPSSRSSRPSSPHPPRRVLRGTIDHGNTMFLGSLAFPTNIVDSQGIVTPPPTHSHAGSRLNVARRMLRRAEHVISQLENPNGSGEQTPVEDPQEEVTPVIEARVIVPSNSSEPLDEAAILSAVHNYSMMSNNRRGTTNQQSNSTTNASTDSQQGPSTDTNSTFPENASRTSSMADLLTQLNQLQSRFAPFLQRYHNFMADDPIVSPEDSRNLQTELNRVSEVMHFLGHAYHSLSDIIIRVRNPPPRALLCRPILIQHSAVLQAGIPIQVEAHVNLSNERPSAASSSQGQSGETSTPNTSAPTAPPQPYPSQGIPLISSVSVPIPLEVRSNNEGAFMINPLSSAVPRNLFQTSPTTGITLTSNRQQETPTSNPPTSTDSSSSGASNVPTTSSSDPEVEFIMEVTPEGITIDSLETTIIGSNQAQELLGGALSGQQPPNLIQSIMQVAGQLINRRGGTGVSDPNASQQSSTTSAPPLTPTPPAQNSQARGNNQTNPTSSTHTRSTARPHVHLQHQTMHGGFDPFLPCNSHHVSRRRNIPQSQQPQQQQQQQTPSSSGPRSDQAPIIAQDTANQLNNLMNTIVSSIRQSYQVRRPATSGQPEGAVFRFTTGNIGESSATPPTTAAASERPAPSVQTSANDQPSANSLHNGPTLAEMLQSLPPDNTYVPGESVITDFIMLLSRNLTIRDVFTLNSGNMTPIARMANEIQNFFVQTIMNGSSTTEAVNSGIERLLREIQPFLRTLTEIPIRDNIDIEASLTRLLRIKLPALFRLSSRLSEDSTELSTLIQNLVSTFKEFCAIVLYAYTDGLRGVDQIFEIVATRYMTGIPVELQEWTLMTSRAHLRQLMTNLDIPFEVIEPHIVRRNNEQPTMVQNRGENNKTEQTMEVEEIDTSELENVQASSPLPTQTLENSSDPLPNVVIGSENWHNQVPADWVPIITKDAQRQAKQRPTAAYSDAYLNGMPSKRRKLVHGNKVRQDLPLPQIIAESVRIAVNETGLTSAAPVEMVAQAAGASTDIQAAYRGLLRSSVQPTIRDNEDFTPERFPHATNYFGDL